MRYQIINERKRALNLTNAQLAEMANVTLSTLDKITSGANDNPKLSTLQAIARAIGCTLDDFDDLHEDVLSEDALALAHKYDKLDAHGQAVVSAVLDLEAERCAGSQADLQDLAKRYQPVSGVQKEEQAE